MGKSLLIVESPTKARTLERYLGGDFIVKASVGHVKDLPQRNLGIDLQHRFQPEYQIIHGKKKVIRELSSAAAKADAIFLGPDPDREGEAIAWHIAEEIDTKDKPVHRVMFYELTRKAIEQALAHPASLNRSLYEAQQARRILDRLVGYKISPILWQKVAKGLSAGRVQSVALRLVCERERDIQKFVPEEYWTIAASLVDADKAPVPLPEPGTPVADSFQARLVRYREKKCKISTEAESAALVETLSPLEYVVQSVERKQQKRRPSPPFITSTLQQEAARRLRFTARRTMATAQQLYEGVELGAEGAVGLITYMRTDSTRLSDEAVRAARTYITQVYGKDYLPAKPVVYRAGKSAQDAHEAIRPTDVARTPEAVAPYLNKQQRDLYTLIWNRFVACQMAPALIALTTVNVAAGAYTFRATGSVVEFPGFMKVYVESRENHTGDKEPSDNLLPELREGQVLTLLELLPKQHFTQPPPRFSEASLIKELEDLGIGRPSTYASILSTIVDREYVLLEKRRLRPTELGFLINDLLVRHFPDIIDVAFTARMEENLDEIEQGSYPYLQLLEEFYERFAQSLEAAEANMVDLKGKGWPIDQPCPKCSEPLVIRWSRNGPFVGCSAYPDCRFTSNYERDEKGAIHLVENKDTMTDETCDQCGRPMVLKRGRFGPFLACSGYPECKNTRSLSRSTGIACPAEGCDGQLVERSSRKGRRFYGCNRYPKCKTTFWDQPVDEKCPKCGYPVLLEKQSKQDGWKRVCPNKPCGYTSSPKVEARPRKTAKGRS